MKLYRFFASLMLMAILSSTVLAQTPDTGSSSTPTATGTTVANPNSSPDTDTLPTTQSSHNTMDKLVIAAAILSVLSLAGNGVIYWLLKKNLEKHVDYQRKKLEDQRQFNSKLQTQIASSLSKENELIRLKQRLQKIEEQMSSTANAKTLTGGSTADYAQVFGTPTPQGFEPYSSRSPGGAQIGHAAEYAAPAQPISPYASIVDQYNSQPESLERNAKGVAETENSLERRRLNASTDQVTLGQTNNPSYWVVSGGTQEILLIPKAGLKLRVGNIETFGKLFNIQGDPNNQEFQLISPAQVTYISSTNEWELDTKGIVQF